LNHYLQRITPWEAGLDPDQLMELYQFLARPEMGMHSFMVLHHGKVASEAWWAPYAPEKPHTMFSASKTFTGLAAGFAVEEGLLHLDDRVVDFFPDYLPAGTCENMEKMRVRHLLTMTTGFAKDPHDFPWPRPDDILATGPHCCHQGIEQPQIDWIRNFFNHYVAYEPGTEFVYCTHGTYMLSAVIQRAVGRTVSAYLNEKLFLPLGIGTPFWETGPDGCTVGGWGLMLTTEQLAVVGQWMLNGGNWKGTQLLSREWIRDASSVHITMDHLDEPHMAGYGYQMWIDQREGACHFKGAFGQECTVIPGKDMVIAYTGGSSSQARRAKAIPLSERPRSGSSLWDPDRALAWFQVRFTHRTPQSRTVSSLPGSQSSSSAPSMESTAPFIRSGHRSLLPAKSSACRRHSPKRSSGGISALSAKIAKICPAGW